MAEDGSSGPRAPEPAQVDSHEGDRHEAPRGRGASRPKGDGGAKGKDKAKVRAAQGKGPSPAKGKKSSKGKVSSGKAPAQSSSYPAKGTEGTEGVRRRSASSIEYSRRRAGKRQREAGQFVRWSKEPAQPSGAKAPPPPPRTAARTEEYSYYSDESGAAAIRLRSRSPNDPRDTRRPAEPTARALKSRNTRPGLWSRTNPKRKAAILAPPLKLRMLLLGQIRQGPRRLSASQERRCLRQQRHRLFLARSLDGAPRRIRVPHPVHPLVRLQWQSQGLRNHPAQGRSRSLRTLALSLSGWCRRNP